MSSDSIATLRFVPDGDGERAIAANGHTLFRIRPQASGSTSMEVIPYLGLLHYGFREPYLVEMETLEWSWRMARENCRHAWQQFLTATTHLEIEVRIDVSSGCRFRTGDG